MQQAGADRVAPSVHRGQRRAEQLDRSGVVVDEVGRLGGPLQQRDPVDRGELCGPRHPRPQLQGVLVVPLGLGKAKVSSACPAAWMAAGSARSRSPAACQWWASSAATVAAVPLDQSGWAATAVARVACSRARSPGSRPA
jgi:hypothetical protein